MYIHFLFLQVNRAWENILLYIFMQVWHFGITKSTVVSWILFEKGCCTKFYIISHKIMNNVSISAIIIIICICRLKTDKTIRIYIFFTYIQQYQ